MLRFKLLGRAAIKDIPTDHFNELIPGFVFVGSQRSSAFSLYAGWRGVFSFSYRR